MSRNHSGHWADRCRTRSSPLIRRLCAESNVVGFELVELLPYRVSGYEAVLNSDRVVRELLVGIVMRKKGIADEHYLAPLTVDDDQQ